LLVVALVWISLPQGYALYAAAATSTPTPTPTVPSPPDAIVAAKTVNLRTGPATSYARLASISAGTPLFVIGHTDNCAWLKVKTQAGREGWVARLSGGKPLVTLNKPCASIPTAQPPTPAAKSAVKPVTKPAATPTVAPVLSSPTIDPNLGCYQMENYLGVELNVTLTAVNWKWNDSFKVPPMEKHVFCLAAGKYSYTIDAPPPWSNLNGTLDVQAGERMRWPIQAQK
jgi:serine protease Do